MKRTGGLYEKIATYDALWNGYLDAKKSKAGRRACLEFEKSIGTEINNLLNELRSETYEPRPYFSFEISEPKKRTIYAPAFRDCVVQHAIYTVVMPIYEKTFIDQSFACRKGKGTHKAADYAQDALRRSSDSSYLLQLDIRKFFYSIDRCVLESLLRKKIKDEKMIRLMVSFAKYDAEKGIPIGNLLSQMFALVYLNPLDHFVVRELKPKPGYCRYVDDFVLFGLTRTEALENKARIIKFISRELGLELSKSRIAKTSKGINFCGYRTWRSARFVRKHSLYKARRSVRANKIDSLTSHLAHASKTHSLQHILSYTEKNNVELYRQLPKSYRSKHHAAIIST